MNKFNQQNSVELAIIAGIWERPEIRAELIAINPKLFFKFRDFFEKSIRFVSGEKVNFGKYWDYIQEFKDYWCPPVTKKLIDQLKREYIENLIAKNPLSTKEEMERVMAEIYSLQEIEDKSLDEILDEILIERSEGKTKGVQTGIDFLDRNTLGLKECHFWIIGGYTSVGKTQFALEMIKNIAKNNLVFFYSLEMSKKDLFLRLLTMFERELGLTGIDELRKLKLKIFNDKTRVEQIESHLIAIKEKPKVVFIDFIQNVKTDDKSEYERLTNVALNLQSLALRESICVVGLSQVSNESANNDKKTMGFKGSGAIAAACDVGIELVRGKDESNLKLVPIECRIRKNRHGKTAVIDFELNKDTGNIIF